MGITARLIAKFSSYYADKPVLTIMITNAVLGGIADTVAQTLTSVRQGAGRQRGGAQRDDFLAIQIHELDEKNKIAMHELIPDTRRLPLPFDFERLTRFMAYGFIMSPIQFHWFAWLSSAFPITKTAAMIPVVKRMACDQLMFSPFGLACFFTFMTVAEGGGKRAISKKLQDMYLPTLKANWMLWPAVQMINFRLMPIQFQIPFVSSIGIAWTAYLSIANATEDNLSV